MEVYATAKSVRISPRKVRLVVDAVRNMPLDDALHALEVMPKRAAKEVAKTLKSAVANATNNAKLERDNLEIGSIMISEGAVFKRFRPSTRGRIHPYKKRSSNIRIMVVEKAGVKPVKTVAVAEDKKTAKAVKAEKTESKAVKADSKEKKGNK